LIVIWHDNRSDILNSAHDMSEVSNPILTQTIYAQAIAELTARDQRLSVVVSKWGPPPFWTHEPGFAGLVLAILSQQVSLESAQAAFDKLERVTGPVEPKSFLRLDDVQLRQAGFSRQKASYVRGLAQAMLSGELDLDGFASLDDDQVRASLIAMRGIGPWTADTYLLFALRRPDAWPTGDLALAKAIQELNGLAELPSWDEVDRTAESWRPWRSVAARILWHHYLSERGR
jgi:DNA-3-methyladenine glycosylase II